MFFVLSKLFWFFAQPLNLAIVTLFAGLLARLFGARRLGGLLPVLSLVLLATSAWTSAGALMLNPLEERFQRPELPRDVAGIVVLGGGLEGAVNMARGGYELNAGGDRFVETAALALRFPQARIVISGGTGALLLEGEGDADTAPRLLAALGVGPDRLVLENRSRNTFENALFTRALIDPAPGETWLLVTSAFHMPRAMGLFRRAGFPVLPWPVDYRTSGREGIGLLRDNPADALQNTTTAFREWIGLGAYRLTGRIDRLLPAPD
jgi:uncharacterized SAM-binding protein YcdF (DUF218 family)